MVGERQQLHGARHGERDQCGWGQHAVGPAAVQVQVDALEGLRGGVHGRHHNEADGDPASHRIAQPMNNPASHRIPWPDIDDVLLDLDGTLLDLDFDNHFWQVLVPQAWGSARGLDAGTARALLKPRFDACAGTLTWYSTDYWSRELELDIAALKRADAHRICWLPGAREFLGVARGRGKRLLLLTNAHPDALAIKHERTGVLGHFDAAYSSHQLGAPKEDANFWRALLETEPIDLARSLFADDSPSVLRAARAAGVGHIRAIRRPDSARSVHAHDGFVAVDALADLLVSGDDAPYPSPR